MIGTPDARQLDHLGNAERIVCRGIRSIVSHAVAAVADVA